MRFWVAALFNLAFVLFNSAATAQVPRSAGLIREAVAIPFVIPGQRTLMLQSVVTRPSTAGRYPLVIISHGTPRNLENAAKVLPMWAAHVANDFARRGWAVAAVVRRGYGHSEGGYAERYAGPCERRNYRPAGLATAQDIIQAVKFLQSRPYVDPNRVLLIGKSAGGFGSIAAASLSPDGLVAVINFAGGRGSRSDDFVCSEDALTRAYASYGRTVRVPTLWIYAANDRFFGPRLAGAMFAAFRKAGGPGELVIAPPHGRDGHDLFYGVSEWRPIVDPFLRKYQLPNDLPNLVLPAGASSDVVKQFERYIAMPYYEKAFAIAVNGRFGWVSRRRSESEALADALKVCGPQCEAYAVNDTLAKPSSSAGGPPP